MTFYSAMSNRNDIMTPVNSFTDVTSCADDGDTTEFCYAILALSIMMHEDNLKVRTASEDDTSKTV